MRGTWEDYTQPKYKKALDRWSKDTGGGDGTPASFVEYCGLDRWLVFIFVKDMATNFLLAPSAGGRMLVHLQLKAEFEDPDVSSTEDYNGGGISK